MARSDKYNLDNVANVEGDDSLTNPSGGIYPMGKGNVQMDGVISVDTDASVRYRPDPVFPTGSRVTLDATTSLPMGEGARSRYAGDTGDIETWPEAFE